MCMLSYFPAGIMPKEEHITNGATLNPDGHGYAIVSKGQISIFKSMEADETIERFMEARAKAKDGPALFHSRIATSGLVDITGCHPFHVGRDKRTVLAHNGILFKPTSGIRSDTRIFAEDMLPRFGSLDRRRAMKQIEKYVGWGNKLVVLTVDPAKRKSAYLFNEDRGTWVDGEWHSNDDYLGAWWEKYEAGKSKRYEWINGHLVPIDEVPAKSAKESADAMTATWECEVCFQRGGINANDLTCAYCGCCQDCREHYFDCQCWSPSRKNGSGLVIPFSDGPLAIEAAANKYALNS